MRQSDFVGLKPTNDNKPPKVTTLDLFDDLDLVRVTGTGPRRDRG